MTSARHRAVALSSFDLPDAQELLVYSCEDCACPVSDTQERHAQRAAPPVTADDPRRWVRGTGVVEMELDAEHRLLFNPPAEEEWSSSTSRHTRSSRASGNPRQSGTRRPSGLRRARTWARCSTRLSQCDSDTPRAGRPAARQFARGRR